MGSDNFTNNGQPGDRRPGRHAKPSAPSNGVRRAETPSPRSAPVSQSNPRQYTQGRPTDRGAYPQQGQLSQYQNAANYQRQNQQYRSGHQPYSRSSQQAYQAGGYQAGKIPQQVPGTVSGRTMNKTTPCKKKMKIWKKVLLIILSVILGLGVTGAAVAFWYTSSLDSNMRGDDQFMAGLSGILDNKSYSEGTYTLVLASDSRSGTAYAGAAGYEDGSGRSDVIMLVRTDPVTNVITLVSIPRDTPIEIDGQKTKINEAFRLGGAVAEIEAVEQVTGVRVSHYVQIDFEGLERFVDTLGGIVVDVPIDIEGTNVLTGEPIYLSAGDGQRLNGAEALTLARTRKDYGIDQDERRQFGVREMVTAIIKEITSKSPLEMPGLIGELSTYITSDVSTSDMATLASGFVGEGVTIYSCTGPSKGAEDPNSGAWLCYENPEGWKNLMTVVEQGGDPSGIDVNSTAIVP